MGTADAPQEKASEPVLIKILGKQYVSSDRIVRPEGVDEIGVKRGERIVWKNTQNQVCKITFTKGGCPFGHDHKKCFFTIERNGTREEDIVCADVGRKFEFSAEFEGETIDAQRGTPRIIVKG